MTSDTKIAKGKTVAHVAWAVRKAAEATWEKADDMVVTVRATRDHVMGKVRAVQYAMQRIRRGYSDRDLWNLGDDEVLRLANMLEEFSLITHGTPRYYGDRRRWLVHRDDSDEQIANWMDSIAVGPDAKLILDRDGKGRRGMLRFQKVSEYGAMHCAWREDLQYAATVLRAWHEWQQVLGEQFDRCRLIFGWEEATRRHDEIEAKFQKVWAWLGRNMGSIWD